MDRIALTQRFTELIGKYKYVLIVVIVGIVLMLLPGENSQQETQAAEQTTQAQNTWDITKALTEILGQIQGAGKVKVLLTVAGGQNTVYQYDEDGSGKKDTVIVTDGDRSQSGLIQRVDPPVYQGAIIVCQGADNDVVRLHIIEAVARVTGLGTDKISVLKMK